MFEQRAWSRTGLVEGPVPLLPSSLVAADVLAWADRAPISGAWMDAVAAIDPVDLSGGERIGLVRAWERLRRGMDAGFTAAVGAIAARPCKPEPGDPSCDGGRGCVHDWSREDTAMALGVGPETARRLLEESRELVGRLPGLLAEVAEGRASFTHARRAAARTLDVADDRVVASIAEDLAGRAAGRTVGAFDRLVATVIDRHREPAEVLAAHTDALRAQTGIRPLPPMADGLGGAVIIGPAEKIAALFGWARQFTKTNREPDDPRTVGQRRLDALLAGVLHPQPADPAPATGAPDGPPSGAPGGPPDREPPRVSVALKLVLSASTLLGEDNEAGWLEGYGDLPAALARQLAVDPETLQRLLAHPVTGHLLDLSPEVRAPGAGLDRYIRARDGVCAGPGCGAGTVHADLDHITPVSQGGDTTRANLHAVCKRSHRLRHPGGWTVRRNPDDTETWTDPHGNSYQTHPTRYPTRPAGGPPPATSPSRDRPPRTIRRDRPDFDELEPRQPPGPPGSAQPGPERPTTAPPDDPCPF